jgi:hypothetical protein
MAGKSAGSDAIGSELDDIMATLADHESRIAALEEAGEGGGEVDPPDPGGGEGEVDPPPTGGTGGIAPREWNDPRFANMREMTSPYQVKSKGEVISNLSIKTTSGSPAIDSPQGYNYTIKNCRFDCKEGPRISGSGSYLFEDVLVLFQGTGDDHADGIQDYGPGNAPTVKMVRVGSRAKAAGANNAACMFVDNARANVEMDACDFDGAHCPSKGLFIANVGNDIGTQSLKVRNTILRNGTRFEGDLNVKEWTNNTDGAGKTIPSPSPVRP